MTDFDLVTYEFCFRVLKFWVKCGSNLLFIITIVFSDYFLSIMLYHIWKVPSKVKRQKSITIFHGQFDNIIKKKNNQSLKSSSSSPNEKTEASAAMALISPGFKFGMGLGLSASFFTSVGLLFKESSWVFFVQSCYFRFYFARWQCNRNSRFVIVLLIIIIIITVGKHILIGILIPGGIGIGRIVV